MFDIGFAELLIIAVVGLLVIGPDRLPETIRTLAAWLGKFRRSFNDIREEVKRELHNDAVMRELRETQQQVEEKAGEFRQSLEQDATSPVDKPDDSERPKDETSERNSLP
jgi:sec-independent protein translocase protein TatB